MNTQQYLRSLPRNVFFTGKGGVGKTSIACATSVALASDGRRVLLVSTDPASNLDEVLGMPLSPDPKAVAGVFGLWAMNIDPVSAAAAYRERVVSPYRGVLPDVSIASMEEQLSGACTVEIAAFNEFTKLLASHESGSGFDHIVFDTAPTGHTLRLLKLPGAWTGFIDANTSGTSCLGPLKGLQEQRELYESSLHNLANAGLTMVVLVSRPERGSLVEAERTFEELHHLGVSNQMFVLNGEFAATDRSDPIALSLEKRGQAALSSMNRPFASLPRLSIPLMPYSVIGVPNLKRFFSSEQTISAAEDSLAHAPLSVGEHSLATVIDEIEAMGPGAVLTMGKGGVGKTTMAAAIAIELARRGHPVRLTTTDPAAHLASTLATQVACLTVTRIDPRVETERYCEDIRAQSAPFLDADGLALLEEDLRSPCTEEIAVFRAFAETIAEGENAFVIVDTAPTGHTILLLDAAETYHREVVRSTKEMPEAVRQLLPRLRDQRFTRILLVTLPEATPIHEAAALQSDLNRAGINPFAWIVNQCFLNLTVSDPTLAQRRRREFAYVAEVRESMSKRIALVDWRRNEPIGKTELLELVHSIEASFAFR